jgi:SOS response regulatory protein OraA/RecX
MNRSRVVLNGYTIDFDAATNLMDNDIIERMNEQEWTSDQAYLDAYVVEHAAKFNGEEFQVA